MPPVRVRQIENFKPETVRQTRLWEEVLTTLRLSIIRGDFPPGTRLIEADLADRLGVSRGPVREALRQLENEGLVSSQVRRSVVVVGISEDDICEIYALRTLLECYAIERLAQGSTPEQVSRLREHLQQMREALEQRQMQAVIEADMLFHRSMIEMASRGRLLAMWESLAASILALLAMADSVYEDMPIAIEQHSMVVDAIERHDGQNAAEQMRRYLVGGEQIIRTAITKS